MKRIWGKEAVSEILGSVLLLAIAISVFSVIYINVLSNQGPPPEIFTTVVGKIESGEVVFEHRSGEEISLDSEVVFTIGGRNKEFWIVNDLLSNSPTANSMWNIGEQLIYHPIQNLTDVQIEASVVDKDTGSLVFWGILQEGYVVPPFGMGGIWHFDEPFWNGTIDEVKDSSGNENHGTAKNGANTTSDDPVNIRAGRFDGIDDCVEVDNHYSLNIRDTITIEAWIKPLELNTILEDRNYGQAFAYNPEITRISDNIYAVVSGWGKNRHEGLIHTLKIFSDGAIEDIVGNNSFQFDNWSYKPDMAHLSGDNYVIAFSSKNQSQAPGRLKTVTIASDGQILQSYHDEYQFDSDVFSPDIIKISNNTYAVVYYLENYYGIIKTINITSDGQINGEIDTCPISSSDGYEPNIVHIHGDIYAVAYRGPSNHGFIKTINITSDGIIHGEINSFEFDTSKGYEPTIIHINETVYAIVYHQSGNAGVLKTINITTTGQIFDNIYNNTLVFSSGNTCYQPRIIKASDGIYAIVYPTGEKQGNSEGKLITVEIENNGTISKTITTLLDQIGDRPNKFFEPDIIQVGPIVLAVVYRESDPHDGKVTTVVIGEDLTPVWSRGIVKGGAASIYANTTSVIGCINGPEQLLTLPITPNIWSHVVLTYDGSFIRLYCNFNISTTPKNSPYYAEMSYSGLIQENTNKLMFGYLFSGLIDEIAIFDHALTDDEITLHRECKGDCYLD